MGTFEFRPAKRENVPLLLGVAGGTGSGKTLSALLLARGIAQGQPFCLIDTENGRGLHYADEFPEMQHGDLAPPFRPERYTAAITRGSAFLNDVPKNQRVVVVDSFSHEWAGDGGCLDWKDEISGGDDKRSAAAWAKVKPAHKKMMTKLLQLDAHVILCLRAEEKMDIVRKDGKLEFVPKRTLPGGSLDGWVPITEKNAPYEMTASFLLVADAPGVPRPLKLQAQHRPLVPLDRPLTERVGRDLAAWAAGGSAASGAGRPESASAKADDRRDTDEGQDALASRSLDELAAELNGIVAELGRATPTPQRVAEMVAAGDLGWLEKQIAGGRKLLDERVTA